MARVASETTISRLTLRPLMTVSDRARAGKYGPTFRRGRSKYAAIERVQSVEGVVFGEAQIIAAAATGVAEVRRRLDVIELGKFGAWTVRGEDASP